MDEKTELSIVKKLFALLFFIQFWVTFAVVKILHFLFMIFSVRSILQSLHRKKQSVVFLEAWFPDNAGYHYRSKLWSDIFQNQGFRSRVKSVMTRQENDLWLAEKNILFHIKWLWKRTLQVLSCMKYKTVIVRRDLILFNDYGNLFMEKFLISFHPHVILDFDDDISAAKKEPREIKNIFGQLMLEQGNKFRQSLLLYKGFIVGSNYLRDYVKQCNSTVQEQNILVIPTCVDYDQYFPKEYPSEKNEIIFGWIGGTGNMPYLDLLIPALNRISKKRKIKLLVITGRDYEAKTDFEIMNCRWSLETEISDMMKMDIGLMPLWLTAVAKGKCGFKLIQYMGLGIVSIATGITANNEIIDDNQNGFIVEQEENWEHVIEKALVRWNEFNEIGRLGRTKILNQYTFRANTAKYSSFLNQ